MSAASIKAWLKAGESPQARRLFALAKRIKAFSVPCIPAIHRPLYNMRFAARNLWAETVRVVWTTPLFLSRLERPARGVNVYGGMPLVLGPLKITMGDRVRISGQTTLTGRGASQETPELIVGENAGIGWQTTIAVGRRVVIGDNVRIAGRAFLAGYPGHPVDAEDRAAGLPDTEDQIGDIVLERDVWLGTGVTVSAGVTIGRGTIVAAGSVVTRDLPPNVLAAGVPAKVIRSLSPGEERCAA